MDRLVEAECAGTEAGGGEHSHRSADHRGLIGENIPKRVLRHDDVEVLWSEHQTHGAGVNQHVLHLNVRIVTGDAHGNLAQNHGAHAREIDRPIAGLIRDLKQRGLLDETLVMWHTEFGRMPISQKGVGRVHNPGAMSLWMAGAGIRGGQVIGSSDEFGYKAAEQPVSYHDVHATMLHLMGMDHKRLTYLFNGRQMRLTDVHGELIRQLVG